MASIDYLSERRMHNRQIAHIDERMTLHTALSMFLVILMVMLMLALAYFYATYTSPSSSTEMMFGQTQAGEAHTWVPKS